MDLVAGGISEALITTETGLVIALPGLFFQYHLSRERSKCEASWPAWRALARSTFTFGAR